MKSLPWFFGLLIAVVAIAVAVGLNPSQVLAVGIFASFILGTLFYWQFRLAFALIGMTALLGCNVIDVPHFIEFANVDIILFLITTMIIVGFLEERKFFEVLLERILVSIGRRPNLLFAAMLALAMLASALVGEVTSILFMGSLTLHLARRFKLDPVPFVLMMVLTTNIGSSATVVGNPVGVLIALRAGLSFPDFLRWATPISVACLFLTIGICFLYYRRPLRALAAGLSKSHAEAIQVERFNRKEFRIAGFLFGAMVLGLILHHQAEEMLGLQKNTLLLGVPLLIAGIAVFLEGEKARELVEKRVDWWTLAFFILLFASVGTLRYVGVTDRIASALKAAAGAQPGLLLGLILGLSGLLTAFLDNVLVVAAFIPVVADLAAAGLPVHGLWWALLFGGTLGGNATMIGSTANIVAIGMLEKEGHPVRFGQWLGPGLVVTLPTLALAFLLLLLQLPLLH